MKKLTDYHYKKYFNFFRIKMYQLYFSGQDFEILFNRYLQRNNIKTIKLSSIGITYDTNNYEWENKY